MGKGRRVIPRAVERACIEKLPLYWLWYEKPWTQRTGRSGYALYAQTGFHENGAIIQRRLYVALGKEQAWELSAILDERLGSKHVSRSLDALIRRMRWQA